MSVRLIDETEFGLGWMEDAREHRAGHALVVDGRIWLVDPIDPEEVETACSRSASRQPSSSCSTATTAPRRRWRRGSACRSTSSRRELPGTPFELVPVVRNRLWREVALWWPQRRTLVCADALGTIAFFRAGGERVGVHPAAPLRSAAAAPRSRAGAPPRGPWAGPPRARHGDARGRCDQDARRRIPRWLLGLPGIVRRGG